MGKFERYEKIMNSVLEHLKVEDVDKGEPQFKRVVLHDGYLDLRQFNMPTSKVKIVYNPEDLTLNFGIYQSNELKYYSAIKLSDLEWRSTNE